MTVKRPDYLYHGSPHLLTILEPRPARGVGNHTDQLSAVYASPHRYFALAFVFTIMPTSSGHVSWRLEFDADLPKITIQAGSVDLTKPGYLYRVLIASFEPLDDTQWVSYAAVTPLDYEIIQPIDYMTRIAYMQE